MWCWKPCWKLIGSFLMDIRRFLPSVNTSENDGNNKRGTQEKGSSEPKPPQAKRRFVPSWKRDFPWLDYRDTSMFCTWCEEKKDLSDSSSIFVSVGCNNFRLETLQSHSSSIGHRRVADTIRINWSKPTIIGYIPRALQQLPKETVLKLEKLFDISYFVAKLYDFIIYNSHTFVY